MSKTTEIEEAVKLARDSRDLLLVGKGSLEEILFRFFTAAQMMGRVDDSAWAEKEINGYEKDDIIPGYRVIFSQFNNSGIQIFEVVNNSNISEKPIVKPISIVEHHINNNLDYTFQPDENTWEDINKIKSVKFENLTGIVRPKEFVHVISGLKLEILKRITKLISEVVYGEIPREIFKEFKEQVDSILTDSYPYAISSLNKAYESLGSSEDQERISQVALACRRLLKHVADKVFPANSEKFVLELDGKKLELDVTEDKVLNRLTAFSYSIDSRRQKLLLRELDLLKEFYSGDQGSINKGVHDKISNVEARRLVLYTYVILGDIVLESKILTSENKNEKLF